ncbi:hypothetical protein HDU86_002371 [Geranomyces michiganensis]|nr:hypothetical protein HDU86_002371 [Geranomyces michiganensis]
MLPRTILCRATLGAARHHVLPLPAAARAQEAPSRSLTTPSDADPPKRSVVADLVFRANKSSRKLQILREKSPVDDLKTLIRKGDGRRAFDRFRQLANEDQLDGFWIQDYNELLRLVKQTAAGMGGVDAAVNRVRNSEFILGVLRSKGFQPNAQTWVLMATTYALLGRVDKTDDMINKAAQHGFKLRNAEVLRLLALSRNSPIEALEQFEAKVEADPEHGQEAASVYNRLLSRFSASADRERFSRLLALGRRHGVAPDGGTYDVLVNHFANTIGNMEEARKMMDQRIAYQLGRTTRGYNALLRGYLNKKDWSNFDATMEEMEQHNVTRNNTTFNTIIAMHAERKQPVKAMQEFFKMYAHQIPVTTGTRAVLARAACHYKSSLRSLILAGGGMPSAAIYMSLINGAVDDRLFHYGLRIIEEFRLEGTQQGRFGFKVTSPLLVKELSCWARLNDVARAEQMLEHAWADHGFEPNAWAYIQLILMYCRPETRNVDQAFAMYHRMLAETSNPAAINLTVFTALLMGVWKHGQPVVHRALWAVRECVARELVDADTPSDNPISGAIAAIGDGDYAKGLELVRKDVAAGFEFPQELEGSQLSVGESLQDGEPLDAADVQTAAPKSVSGSASTMEQTSSVADGEPLDAADVATSGDSEREIALCSDVVNQKIDVGDVDVGAIASDFSRKNATSGTALNSESEPLDAADTAASLAAEDKGALSSGPVGGEIGVSATITSTDDANLSATSRPEGEPLDAADAHVKF